MLSHADLCRLGRVFNAGCDLRSEQDRRVNDWLRERIAEAKERECRHAWHADERTGVKRCEKCFARREPVEEGR